MFINQLPPNPDIYVHRSGRTGHYDKAGIVISFVTQRDLSLLRSILRQIKQKAEWLGTPPPVLQQKKNLRPKRPNK